MSDTFVPRTRIVERLAGLSLEDLTLLAAHGCENNPATLLYGDKLMASQNPLPQRFIDEVLQSDDIFPALLAHLHPCAPRENHHVALVCKAWANAWRAHCHDVLKLPLCWTKRTLDLSHSSWTAGVRYLNPLCVASDQGTAFVGVWTCEEHFLYSLNSNNEVIFEIRPNSDSFWCVSELALVRGRIFVADGWKAQIFSFDASNGQPLGASPRCSNNMNPSESMCMVVTPDGSSLYCAKKYAPDLGIMRLDVNTLEPRGSVPLDRSMHPTSLAILHNRLFMSVSTDTIGMPVATSATVHILTMDGTFLQSCELSGVYSISKLVAAHGRLYAIEEEAEREFIDEDLSETEQWHAWEAVTDCAGKRIVVLAFDPSSHLSETLSVLHFSPSTARAPMSSSNFPHGQLKGLCGQGERGLLVANYELNKTLALYHIDLQPLPRRA